MGGCNTTRIQCGSPNMAKVWVGGLKMGYREWSKSGLENEVRPGGWGALRGLENRVWEGLKRAWLVTAQYNRRLLCGVLLLIEVICAS